MLASSMFSRGVLLTFCFVGADAAKLLISGSESSIDFLSGGERATLQVGCSGKTGSWLWMTPKEWDGIPSSGSLGNTSIVLTDIAPTCAQVGDAREPCATDSSHVPPRAQKSLEHRC